MPHRHRHESRMPRNRRQVWLTQGMNGMNTVHHLALECIPVPEDATAIVLAGGKSSRMGVDKAMLPILGKPMIEHIVQQLQPHFRQVLISANDIEKFAFLKLDIIPDKQPGYGPLMGIASALSVSAHDVNVVIACDMPSLNIEFLRSIIHQANGYDCVTPVNSTGHYEPLLAVYRKSVLPFAYTVLDSDNPKIARIFEHCTVRFVSLPQDSLAQNINTLDDYRTLTAATQRQ